MDKICCICGKTFYGYGCNPDGAAWLNKEGEVIIGEFKPGDKCCDSCDAKYVIPGRPYRYYAKYHMNAFKSKLSVL